MNKPTKKIIALISLLLLFVTFSSPLINGANATLVGNSSITSKCDEYVVKKCSTTATCLSDCSITLGESVTDKATVTYGATGQVRFEVSTDGINFVQFGAVKTLSGGYSNTARSDSYTPTAARTYYFRAVYLGDSNYLGSQSGNKDEILTVKTVEKKTTCTTTLLSDCSIKLGESVKDYAYVTAGADGQVRFEVSTDGTTFTQFGAVKTLPGGLLNIVVSDSYTPTAVGTYYFRAVYLGDATHLGSQSGNKDEVLTVKTCQTTTTTNTVLSNTEITLGNSVTDIVAVSGGATGQVRFEVSTDGINFVQFGAVKTLLGGSTTSDSYTPVAVGTYYFRAVYLGDATHLGSQSGNKEEPLTINPATPSISTTLSAASITLGQPIHDVATVTGMSGFPVPTGSVTFWTSTDASSWSQLGGSVPLVGGQATSADFTPLATGTYYFQARYSGDNNYISVNSGATEEAFVVNKATPAIQTTLSQSNIKLGESVTDSVAVTGLAGSYPSPTGTVTFQVSTDNAVTWSNFGTVKTLVSGTATSDSYPAVPSTLAGTCYFRAVYSGDSNYLGATSGDKDEKLTLKIQPVLIETTYLPNLPSAAVTMKIALGSSSNLDITLSNVPTGYSVSNGAYLGWCGHERYALTTVRSYQVYMFDTLSSTLPPSIAGSTYNGLSDWNKVNYILNHKQGSAQDVQAAIWYFINGIPTTSANALAMINDANANPNYMPNVGDTIAVICVTEGWLT